MSFHRKPKRNKIRAAKWRVIAIGTTSLRVLEASGGKELEVAAKPIFFIKPGYKFKVADALITNFHFPKSTLFILTCSPRRN